MPRSNARKQKVRSTAVLISVVSLLATTACTQSSAPADSGTPAPSGKPAASEPANSGPVTFKVLYDYNVDPQGLNLQENEYNKFIKEKTGVEIKLDSPGSAGYDDKLNVLMASGSYPDAFAQGKREIILKYAKDDLLTDLTPYINDTAKYPNIKKYMPADAWLPVTDGGKVWAFPYNRPDGLSQVVYINKDWLKNLNLQIPKTIDEFYTVMKAFTENDPDQNGKKDTFGLLASNTLGNGGRMFQAAFDAETYKIRDGQVLPPEISSEYKDYLKFLNKLVSEKIMDPEFPTFSGAIFQQKLKTLKYGAFSSFWHYPSGLEVPKDVMDHYVAVNLPLHKDGSASKFSYPNLNRHYIAIPKTTKNIDKFMKMLDWAVSPEGMKFSFLGVPGFNYKEDNGKIEVLKQLAPIHWSFSLVRSGQLTDDILKYIGVVYPKEAVDNLVMAKNIGQVDNLQASLPYYPDLANFNLGKIVDEFTIKSILGNTDIDKSWDDYVKRWRSAGGDQVIKFWTDWYNKEGKNTVKQ
ncbi:extracellular solute-binding protein [Paenibacillus cremeus]|nr:extracellular solute-binding protein [Paenibacillus cremeus]